MGPRLARARAACQQAARGHALEHSEAGATFCRCDVPSDWSRGITIDLKTGRELRFRDLFRSGTDLDDVRARAIPEDGCDLPDPEPGLPRPPFLLTPEGIRFVDLFPGGAMRACTAVLPYAELADVARPGGPLTGLVPSPRP